MHQNKKIIFYNATYTANLKSIYEYIEKRHPDWDAFWLVDSPRQVQNIPKKVCVLVRNQQQANLIISQVDMIFEDKFHMTYPMGLSQEIPIVNLWHGVGLKNIELNNPITGKLADRVMTRYVKNNFIYRRQTFFVSSSTTMTQHFIESTNVNRDHFIEVGMPRLAAHDDNLEQKSLHTKILWAPTFRDKGDFETILPLNRVQDLLKVLASEHLFLIFSPHPNMWQDKKFQVFVKLTNKSNWIKIVQNTEDVYDYLQGITYTIIDYSSIFYDLVYLNHNHFIRYIPDFKAYSQFQTDFEENYFSETYGHIATSINELLVLLTKTVETNEVDDDKKSLILEKYFNRQNKDVIEQILVKKYKMNDCDTQITRGLYTINANNASSAVVEKLKIDNDVVILHFDRNTNDLKIKDTRSYFIGDNESVTAFYKRVFYMLLKKYNYDYWRHIGSDRMTDEIVPRKLGIQTLKYLEDLQQTRNISFTQILYPKRLGIYKDDTIFEHRLESALWLTKKIFNIKLSVIKWFYGRRRV